MSWPGKIFKFSALPTALQELMLSSPEPSDEQQFLVTFVLRFLFPQGKGKEKRAEKI